MQAEQGPPAKFTKDDESEHPAAIGEGLRGCETIPSTICVAIPSASVPQPAGVEGRAGGIYEDDPDKNRILRLLA